MVYKLLPMRGWPPRMGFHRLMKNKDLYIAFLWGAYNRMIEGRWISEAQEQAVLEAASSIQSCKAFYEGNYADKARTRWIVYKLLKKANVYAGVDGRMGRAGYHNPEEIPG